MKSLARPILALLLCLLAAPGVHAQGEARPIVIPLGSIKLPGERPLTAMATAALHPNGKRVYLGRQYSTDPKRRNLIVATLDAAGQIVGAPRAYADTTLPLQKDTHSTVSFILPDARHRKLFLTYNLNKADEPNAKKLIVVYDLDADGEPVGTPRTYETINKNKAVNALALHPTLNLLYVVGWGGAAVYVHPLNDKGEPEGEAQAYSIGGQGKFEVAVSQDGKRLYLGSFPSTLEVFDLNEKGRPTGTPHSYVAARAQEYLRFQYAPQAIFMRLKSENGPRLAIWPLDDEGYPVDEPILQEELPVSAFGVDAAHNRLWVAADSTFNEAFTNDVIVDGVAPASFPINNDGTLGAKQVYPGGGRARGLALSVSSGGQALLITQPLPAGFVGNRVADWRMRVTVEEARDMKGEEPDSLMMGVGVTRKPPVAEVKLGTVRVGQPTKWGKIDTLLQGEAGRLMASVQAINAKLSHIKLKIELARGNPDADGEIIHTLGETLQGNNMLFWIPAYGYEPEAQRLAAIVPVTEHAKMYLAAAKPATVDPKDRPKQFAIACSNFMGGQGSIEQLRLEAEAVGRLGFNTTNAYWWGSIPPAEIDKILDANGMKWRSLATYNPPSYFDYDRDKMNPPALDKWAAEFAASIGPMNGGTKADVIDFKLADEPGWYFPQQLDDLKSKPAGLEVFRDFLKSKGMKPQDFGYTAWNQVFPIGGGSAKDLPSRKLFYWTTRFYPESASKAHKMAREAIDRAFGHPMKADVNWNNFGNRWYVGSPNKAIANNKIEEPDTAMGMFDWMESGRLGAHTIWTEDWFGDHSAQTWSMYSDMMRSTVMLQPPSAHPQVFGGYTVGHGIGSHPAGASYKMLSILGHGGKAIDVYTFGPGFLFADGWSENTRMYKPVADAIRRIGRAERLLYPGRPARGKVALYTPGTSGVWETDSRSTYYFNEQWSLHFALVHAGYTVDFVDDKDLASPTFAQRQYTTLYLLGPNVAAAAQKGLATWVQGGGTLVALPGVGVADEYNSPTTTLDAILGLKGRKAVRDAQPHAAGPASGVLSFADATFGKGNLNIFGPIAPLTTTTATAIAKLANGAPAITTNKAGKGRAISYAFYPGWQYHLTPDRLDNSRLPLGWGEAQRRLAVAPVRLANTPKAVSSNKEGVEICRLDSPAGIALVVLNWTDEPISSLAITLPGAGKFRKVTSIEQGALQSQAAGGGLSFSLPVKNVDVLMVE